MLEAKFGDVYSFLLNVACLYPLKPSEKTLNIFNLIKDYRNIRLGLTGFTHFNLLFKSYRNKPIDLQGNSMG